MTLVFVDASERGHLLPLTYTRPVAELRVGIITLAEKWTKRLKISEYFYQTEAYLSVKFPPAPHAASDYLLVNPAYACSDALAEAAMNLKTGEALVYQGNTVVLRSDANDFSAVHKTLEWQEPLNHIHRTWAIFHHNEAELKADFKLLTQGRTSQTLSSTNVILGEDIFVEEGVWAECASFNTQSGPIYLGKDVTVMEGSRVRGALAMCEHSQLNLDAKIYGATTLGPYVKVGGEVNNSVFLGYANKGHDGFLGQAVIGEWCNLGADTNNSNLKNNYEEVKLWNYETGNFEKTGLQFCGLIMGDHSKCGINTMLNTGTVIGVSSNIFGAGFPRNFIPSFAWGGANGTTTYKLDKAFDTAEKVMARRKKDLNETERDILTHIFEISGQYRK